MGAISSEITDEQIRSALQDAHIPTLMLALVHLTGDLDLIRSDIRPQPEFLGDPQDGIEEPLQQRARELAFDIISRVRDEEGAGAGTLSESALLEMIGYLTSQDVSGEYLEFLTAELSMNGEDAYAQPALKQVDAERLAGLRVLVIGAGMSGLLSGIRLKEAGIDFEIIEKNPDVGGTWFENTYPGCRVDSGNHVYSYSFRPKNWPQYFSSQPVLREYFSETADDYGLRANIRFETEVLEMRLDEARGCWRVTVRGADDEIQVLEADAVISAVGQLNRPKMPDLPGLGTFAGPAFHSARWDHSVDFAGKRVGVIGTGGSAFQFVPHVAESAASVTVFQRTAPWVVLNEQYFSEIPDGVNWLMAHVPFYAKWFRFSMFWKSAEGLLAAVTAEDGWNRPERSVSEANEQMREQLLEAMREVIGSEPTLVEQCTPDYPFGAKRALIDDGRWFRALLRDNVVLNTDGVAAINADGIETSDGEQHDFDVLIYGTGFSASDFLTPMQIYGRNGVELHDHWQGDPRAFKGISVPGFPNLFCTYGPNTNIVVNSSIIFFSECEVRYILGCLAELAGRGRGTLMDVTRSAHDEYNERIDAGNAGMAWGQSAVSTWYKNAAGRVTQNWPFRLVDFWQQCKAPDQADYHFEQNG